MSKPKDVNRYPVGMLDLLESVCTTEQPAFMVYTTQKKAEAARFDFYGLKGAIIDKEHSLAPFVTQLTFTLHSTKENPLEKRVLKISFIEREIDSEFYRIAAERHAKEAAEALAIEDASVKAATPAQPQKPE